MRDCSGSGVLNEVCGGIAFCVSALCGEHMIHNYVHTSHCGCCITFHLSLVVCRPLSDSGPTLWLWENPLDCVCDSVWCVCVCVCVCTCEHVCVCPCMCVFKIGAACVVMLLHVYNKNPQINLCHKYAFVYTS